MISGLRIHEQLDKNYNREQVTFTIDPYTSTKGPLRSIQKFTILLLTTKGTDAFHTSIGTNLSQLRRMNVIDDGKTRLFIKDQVDDAINQFFTLQSREKNQNDTTNLDTIDAIELISVEKNDYNQYSLKILFTPTIGDAVVFSVNVSDVENKAKLTANYTAAEYRAYLEREAKKATQEETED